jgi:putative heme iron utilization protein
MTDDHGRTEQPAPAPLTPVAPSARRTPAEEARTLVALTSVATLATLSEDGGPWASLVTFAALEDGSPVLYVSTLAEHGRNLERDGRASVCVAQPSPDGDPLAAGRVTLAGVARRPEGAREEQARDAYLHGVAGAKLFMGFGDFSLYVVDVERVRWVGGYGRMDSATPADYAAARADPIGDARDAVRHLNDDHADALLSMARTLGGYPDAVGASCTGADRYGLELVLATPRGPATTRVGYAAPISAPAELRAATVELAQRARAAEAAV